MSLTEKIKKNEFRPEIYVYPTARAYKPLQSFSIKQVKFTDEINIYVHLPFCKTICSYCGYIKIIDNNPIIKERYINCIIKEIEIYKDIISKRKIKTLHFGGGTPSLFSPETIQKIIKKIQNINPNLFKTAQEISLEGSPENVEYAQFLAYKKIGIDRVSLGIQSLDNTEIALCNRKNTKDISSKAFKTLKKIGFKNIVVDLMIGIQGQTVKSFENTVKQLLKIRPDTVELYALGIMPNTKVSLQKKQLMSNKDIYSCYDLGRKLFLEAGYIQDCHNRYAIPGKGGFLQEDYNFADISTIGLGAGTRTYASNIHYRNNYYPNSHLKTIIEYIQDIENNNISAKTGIKITKEEKMRQYAIYNIENLDKSDFKKKFTKSFKQQFPKTYKELGDLKLIKEDKETLKLTDKGLNYRDLIGKELFSKNILKIEREYRYPINVIIFGFSGSGKSTIANEIGKKYGLKIIHPSGILRNLCEGKKVDIDKTKYNKGFRESKKGIKLFNDRLNDKEPLDIQATKIVLNEIKKGNLVVDSRDLPRLTDNGIKIYLKADIKVRAKRVALRSKITYEESIKLLKMKYQKTSELFKELYGIDITKNREVFDYILETDNLNKNEVFNKICNFLENIYPDLKS